MVSTIRPKTDHSCIVSGQLSVISFSAVPQKSAGHSRQFRFLLEHGCKAHGSHGFGPIFFIELFVFLSVFIRMIRAICVLS
jgi:hypothetical protein